MKFKFKLKQSTPGAQLSNDRLNLYFKLGKHISEARMNHFLNGLKMNLTKEGQDQVFLLMIEQALECHCGKVKEDPEILKYVDW